MNAGHWEMKVQLEGSAGVVTVPSSSTPHFPCTAGPSLFHSPAMASPVQRTEQNITCPGHQPATAWDHHPDHRSPTL